MDGQREGTVLAPGVGRAGVVPDVAQLDLSVEVTEASPAVAYAAVNAALSGVVVALDEQGVAARDRQTRRLSLQPHYEYETVSRSGRPTLIGYRAGVGLRVRVSELADVPRVLEAVIEAGGQTVTLGGFALVTSDPRAARTQAEGAAVADATQRAQRLAEAAGARLGPVLAIRHDPPSGGEQLQLLGGRSESGGTATAIEAGEDDVVAQVTIEFALGPGEPQ